MASTARTAAAWCSRRRRNVQISLTTPTVVAREPLSRAHSFASLVVAHFLRSHQSDKETCVDEPHKKLRAVHHIIDRFASRAVESTDELIDWIPLGLSGLKPSSDGIPNQ